MDTAEVLIKFKGDSTNVEEAQDKVRKSFDATKVAGEVAFAAVTAAVGKMVNAFVSAGIEYNAQMETFNTRLTTLTGSGEKADKVMQKIKEDALKTPFDVASLVQAQSLLLSTGLEADQARKDILALGDAISASGGGNEELQRMAVNLQQIKNVGKASSLDIKQFAYAGIDIYGLLADSMGITKAEVKDLDITYEMLSKALQDAASEGGKYYNAMEAQSKTYKGAMSNLEESVGVFKGAMTEGLFNSITNLIPKLSELFDWLTKNKDLITGIIIPILTFIGILAGFMIISKVIALFSALWGVIIANPIVATIALLFALWAGITYLWKNCEGFRNFFINLWESIKEAIKSVWESVKVIGQVAVDGFKKFLEMVKAFFVEPFKKIFNALPDSFKKVGKNIIEGLWKGMSDMKDWAVNKIKGLGDSILKGLKGILGIKSPSKEFALIGKFSVLGYTEALDDMQKDVQKQVGETFGISPQLANSSALNYSPNVIVNNNISMKQDALGQMVNDIKTFSGGSKNDYNYGMGV